MFWRDMWVCIILGLRQQPVLQFMDFYKEQGQKQILPLTLFLSNRWLEVPTFQT